MNSDLLLLFIGALIGWTLQRISDISTRPNITMSIEDSATFIDRASNINYKFLHIKVKNNKRNLFIKFFIGNQTANVARSWISFIDILTNAELLKINGRWATTKEPVDYKGSVNIGDAIIASRETIPPDEESVIPITIKQEGKKECFAFNNESYLYSWQKPDFELTEKRYKIKVKVAAEGSEWI